MLLTDPFVVTSNQESYPFFFIILFEAGRIENEMQKYGKSSKPFFWAARPTEVLKAFEAYTSLLHDLKKGSLL